MSLCVENQISNLDSHKSDYDYQVKKDRETRKSLRSENRECPVCFEAGVIPLGGMNSCWWEHKCGAYSPLSKTWEEAFTDINWNLIDEECNACMYPQIGAV